MSAIERIHAREVFDSRGRPTVEVEVACRGAPPGRAIVPSGASTGRFEAVELRDGGPRLHGAGVTRAVTHVNTTIADALIGTDALDQAALDHRLRELDGTPNKSVLGANAILGVSLATAHASAAALGIPLVDRLARIWKETAAEGEATDPPRLPLPMVNMISGGLHAGGNLDVQDFLILPVGAATFRDALDWVVTVYQRLRTTLIARGYEAALVGDEGGYGPRLTDNREALDLLVEAIQACGLQPGIDVALGLDVASTHFFDEGAYGLADAGAELVSADELIELLAGWVDDYPIVSIEDGLAEDDWEGWRRLTERLGRRVQLIGDDLFVTNPDRLAQGVAAGVANSVLIKLNQIGTLSETLQTMRLALRSGYLPVVSARSGETEDTTIADLAVATAAGQIKIGSVARSERLAKYNQLLRLEERLGAGGNFAGNRFWWAGDR